jgi:hypothetical protein
LEMLTVSIANFVVCFWDHTEGTTFHLIPNFTYYLTLIQCSKKVISVTKTHKHTSYQHCNFHATGIMCLNQVQVETCIDMSLL